MSSGRRGRKGRRSAASSSGGSGREECPRRPRRLAGTGCRRAPRSRARAARRARLDPAASRCGGAGGLRRDPRAGGSSVRRAALDVPDRIAGAWLGRAAGCVLGKPVENIPREGIRAIAEATGNWPVAGLVHRRGTAGGGLGALAVEPREPADEPGREHRRHPGGRRPQLHDARRRAARALRDRIRRARRREDLARLPAARPDLHRGAGGDAQPARGLPATADRDAPQPVSRVDRRAPARRRLRLGRTGRSGRGGPDGVGGRPLSHTANGVYAAMFMAAAHAASLSESSAAACADIGVSVVPARSRLAESLRTARDLAGELPGRRSWTRCTPATATITGCTRSTTRRSPPPRCTPSTATSPAASAASSRVAWTRTRTAPRWGRSSAHSRDGGIDERWSTPLGGDSKLAARLRRDRDRRARAENARRHGSRLA